MNRLDPSFLSLPIAHRALHDVAAGRPENSRAAITAAIDAGYGIEIDLQLSQDRQAMVFHDYALDRLANARGDLRALSAADLQSITLKGGSEGIPSLADVLALVNGRVPLLIEFKDQDGQLGPDIGDLETAAAQLLRSYQGAVAVMSFNPHSAAKLAELLPEIPRGIVTSSYDPEKWPGIPQNTCDVLRAIPDYDRVGASFISHEVADLDRPRVAELKTQGADILCWTVTSAAMEAKARSVADNVTFEQYLAKHPA